MRIDDDVGIAADVALIGGHVALFDGTGPKGGSFLLPLSVISSAPVFKNNVVAFPGGARRRTGGIQKRGKAGFGHDFIAQNSLASPVVQADGIFQPSA